jgi:hypothetical protein
MSQSYEGTHKVAHAGHVSIALEEASHGRRYQTGSPKKSGEPEQPLRVFRCFGETESLYRLLKQSDSDDGDVAPH